MKRLLGAGFVVAGTTAGMVAGVMSRGSRMFGAQGMLLLAAAGFALVGAFLIARSDAGRVGWALALTGLSMLGSGVLSNPDGYGTAISPDVAAAASVTWYGTFAGIGMLMAWFPSGATAGRRWRWLTPLGITATSLTVGAGLFSERICMGAGASGCLTWADNPIGVRGVPDIEYEQAWIVALLMVFVLLAAASLVVRFVGSSGVERLQLKWFATAVGLFAAWLTLGIVTELAGIPLPNVVGDVGVGVVMLALPAAVGVAVTRYHLYEIDRIISRTVSYTVVAAAVVAIYAIPVMTLPNLLGGSNDLVTATSTLAAAAAFTPVRRRVQRAVNTRYNRTRYDAEREVDAFSDRLRRDLTLASIDTAITDTLAGTVQPASTGLWIKGRRP